MPGRLRDPGPRARAALAATSGAPAPVGHDDERDAPTTTTHDPGDDPSRPYEDWTVDELRHRAAELDIDGRSAMRKAELIAALRAV